MFAEERITLECPYCRKEICKPLSWFKKSYSTCPHCQGGLAASQFEAVIYDIEVALDATVEEMVIGQQPSGCCGGGSSSGCGSKGRC